MPLIRISENPIPESLQTHWVTATDGARLRCATYPCDDARGTVIVHPGWAEYLEKYVEVAEDLHVRGFNVLLIDPRGQGYSQRFAAEDRRGLIDDFHKFVRDMTVFFEFTKSRFDGPYVVLAHSMGGLVALEWLRAGLGREVKATALSAPMTRLFSNPAKRAAVRTIVRCGMMLGAGTRPMIGAPNHSMSFESNNLTHDRARHARFKTLQLAAPESQAGAPKFAWLDSGQVVMTRINRKGGLDPLEQKVLLVSAEKDQVVDPTNHARLAGLYPQIEYHQIKGARHELLMETDDIRNQFWAYFDDYVDRQLSDVDSVKPPGASSTFPSSTRSSNMSAI
ncbi:alpha/beta hydrolase [Parvularcula sp. LCG005]|uniref:alpha/beta hydrolase n=1 Tax=Parvularcula sp. LCG005 TaxID=3078805 RepID=UPI0029420AEE|nr:alpha/beta hydrolase [Parvularcula sp. LCG005]WOI54817.1 alpha/beta hydrolase [Parvularcula sp. LCG005]